MPDNNQSLEVLKVHYESQLSIVKDKLQDIAHQFDIIGDSLKNVSTKQSAIDAHISARNGDYIHHISPCTILSEVMEEMRDLRKIREYVKADMAPDFNKLELVDKEIKEKIEKVCDDFKKDLSTQEDRKLKTSHYIFLVIVTVINIGLAILSLVAQFTK